MWVYSSRRSASASVPNNGRHPTKREIATARLNFSCGDNLLICNWTTFKNQFKKAKYKCVASPTMVTHRLDSSPHWGVIELVYGLGFVGNSQDQLSTIIRNQHGTVRCR